MPKPKYKIDFDVLKAATDVEHLMNCLEVPVERKGKELVGWCMLGGDHGKKDSFSVNTEKKTYQCFSCGSRGSIIQFVKELLHMESLPKAAEIIIDINILRDNPNVSLASLSKEDATAWIAKKAQEEERKALQLRNQQKHDEQYYYPQNEPKESEVNSGAFIDESSGLPIDETESAILDRMDFGATSKKSSVGTKKPSMPAAVLAAKIANLMNDARKERQEKVFQERPEAATSLTALRRLTVRQLIKKLKDKELTSDDVLILDMSEYHFVRDME